MGRDLTARKYGYDCPLTLEIREEDYEDCVNYRNTKVLIEDWIQRQTDKGEGVER